MRKYDENKVNFVIKYYKVYLFFVIYYISRLLSLNNRKIIIRRIFY